MRTVWLNKSVAILAMTLTNLLLTASCSVCKMHVGHRYLGAMAEPNDDCKLSLADVITCLRKLGQHNTMFCEVKKYLELFLLMPVTSAMAERSFSGLRRLKTFLRTSMSQELLNSLAILHVHKCLTRELDVTKAAKEFVSRSQYRLSSFGSFP